MVFFFAVAVFGMAQSLGTLTTTQRSAGDEIEEKKDGLFALIRSLDALECGKNLVCELETKREEALDQDEALILSLFR